MRILIVGIVIIALMTTLGCTKTVQYKGGSENWSVKASVNQSTKKKTYQIYYIGQGKNTDSYVNYAFKSSKNFRESGDRKGIIAQMHISGKSFSDSINVSFLDEAGFIAIIKWNNQEEIIEVVRTNE